MPTRCAPTIPIRCIRPSSRGAPIGIARSRGTRWAIFEYDRSVVSLQIVLQSDGGPMSARIELTQGPSNTKQFIDIYSQDGSAYPVSLAIETPGFGKVVRIQNLAHIPFPIKVWVEPCTKGEDQVAEVLPKDVAGTKRILSADVGTNGRFSPKNDAMDIEFQKVIMDRPTRRPTLRQSDHRRRERKSEFMPYFWAKSGDEDDGNANENDGYQSFPPPDGLHP